MSDFMVKETHAGKVKVDLGIGPKELSKDEALLLAFELIVAASTLSREEVATAFLTT